MTAPHTCPKCLESCTCTPLPWDVAYLHGKTECQHACTKELPIPKKARCIPETPEPDLRPCHFCGSDDWSAETEPAYEPVIVGPPWRVIDFRMVHSACLAKGKPRSAFSGGLGWKQDRVPTMYTNGGYREQGGVFTPYQTGDFMPSVWGNVVRVVPYTKREPTEPTKQEQLELTMERNAA